MTSADKVTRFSPDLWGDAVTAGVREQRSARQQLEHWARVGRAVSDRSSTGRRRIESALAGTLPSAQLTTDEAVVFDAEIDASIEADLAEFDFVASRAQRGFTSVALDEQGELVEYGPDGSERALPGE
ncbi:hypothetical protein G4H71_10950 [Rhodococcus triatomae]|uniref:ParD-like antitoxin of type II toxin-antitoxin system n=1 Tax=Rhodococcus triatomae TaxID=300028 RepID=A0A1G8LI07_9NOCA|nr:hypothetical protein [Rhodococcus triatomae]QNG20597.1 hypothetical protein G4H72_19430 [Rhodococcus triatomae]QNG23485.1 hypothetical protein G4H71_10950 [Rhodococcus triatomae]SDI55382.1 ParD-like antitoxin of type II toxin-antitoxin system [Rhodococcus triatomae]